jgi:hypothetical protein
MMSANPHFTVLVNSCDAFEDCWQPFFQLFSRCWPACDARGGVRMAEGESRAIVLLDLLGRQRPIRAGVGVGEIVNAD